MSRNLFLRLVCVSAFAIGLALAGTGCETGFFGCPYTNDGECDDGRNCAHTALCDPGSDDADCDDLEACDPDNSCVYRDDGECDDGRPGAETDLCDPGTDEIDCEGI